LGAVLGLDKARLVRAAGEGVAEVIGAHQTLLAHSLRDRLLDAPLSLSGRDLQRYLVATLADSPTERLRALYLDHGNRLISDELVAEGGPGKVALSARRIVNRALELEASALVFVHNHPGGSEKPSPADVAFTRRMAEIGLHLGILVHDHLIVAGNRCTSLRARGDLG
jgi:DNA repair protein RadC